MEYQNYNITNKDDVEKLLNSHDNEQITHGIVGMVNGIDDHKWVLKKLLELIHHEDYWVAKTSINGLGDLIRINSEIEVAQITKSISSIKREDLSSTIEDLKDDIEVFR